MVQNAKERLGTPAENVINGDLYVGFNNLFKVKNQEMDNQISPFQKRCFKKEPSVKVKFKKNQFLVRQNFSQKKSADPTL